MRTVLLLALLPACMGRFDSDRLAGDCPPPADDTPTDSGTSPDDDTGTTPSDGALVHHVVVFVMDGTRMEESFGDAGVFSDAAGENTEDVMPSVRSTLLPQGTVVTTALNIGIPITGPGHCDLITGVRNSFGHFPTPAGAGWYRPEYPTLFELVSGFEEAEPGRLLLTGNTEHIESLNRSIYPGATDAAGATYTLVADANDPEEPSGLDTDVITAVKTALQSSEPTLVIANLHSIDRAGHYARDPNTNEYLPYAYAERVSDVDQPLVDFWNWLSSSELADDTLVVITADHGRHRWGDEAAERLEGLDTPDYANHGDQCEGCREIPLFLAGPKVKKGAEVDATYTIEDLSRTIAWALGVDHPYGSGVVIRDAFDCDVGDVDRTGAVLPDASEGVVAEQVWNDDLDARASIEVDGEVISDTDALVAEAPKVLVAGDQTYACWREFKPLPGEIDWPWTAQCRVRGTDGVWTDLEFPSDAVYPLFDASLGVDADGALLVAWADNPNATTYGTTRAAVRLLRWSAADGWTGTDQGIDADYPMAPSLALSGGKAWVAWAGSDTGGADDESNDPGRYTRHISVERVSVGADGGQAWTEVWRAYNDACPAEARCHQDDPTLDSEGHAFGRMESPALVAGDDGLMLGFVAYGDDVGNTIEFVQSDAAGATWTTPERLDDTGRVFGHVAPKWGEGWLYWARLSDAGEAELCRWQPGAADASCQGLGVPRVNWLAPIAGGARVSVDVGAGSWEGRDVLF